MYYPVQQQTPVYSRIWTETQQETCLGFSEKAKKPDFEKTHSTKGFF